MASSELHLWSIPFQYSMLIIATITPKLLHLYSHINSLPPLLYLLYLPTFLALDLLNLFLFWVFVHANLGNWLSVPWSFFRGAVNICILGASASWISFYLETGGEIKWGAAKNVAKDPAGLRVLLSGSFRALIVAIVMVVVARTISQLLYNGADTLLRSVLRAFTGYRLTPRISLEELDDSIRKQYEEIDYVSRELEEDEIDEAPAFINQRLKRRHWIIRIKTLAPAIAILVLLAVRPRHFPFAHMSGSMPYTLMEVWTGNAEEICQAGFSEDFPFPLPHLIDSLFWEQANGTFPGWAPTLNTFEADEKLERPPWLPEELMKGFERWYNESETKIDELLFKGVNYDPRDDPLKISNLDQDVMDSFSAVFNEQKAAIKHVVVLSLESTRKDVFPFKKDSYLHQQILKTYASDEQRVRTSRALASLTQNAELLTGEKSGFGQGDLEYTSARSGSWRNLKNGMGGINVQGAFTGSTSSLKSILGSHCGVSPLPVDFTVEVGRQIYQPCLPNILKLFNHNKVHHEKDEKPRRRGLSWVGHGFGHQESRPRDFSSMPWKSAYLQSITDQYDHQDRLNQHMGFDEVIVKDTLSNSSSKHYPPTEPESNYFGYPETQLKAYLQDLFLDAEKNNQRLFLSHLTGSTHHPWNTPDAFGPRFDYLRPSHWRSEHSLNRYLNTIKFSDAWIGEIMDVLEDMNVADETLVVMVGDHGWAFQEDSNVRGTFENGHIANLRVPLVFHHPLLPRVQLEVNATSMSIIPTILDLLTQTESLDKKDIEIASNLIHQYEGQSLIRPFVRSRNGRQQWNIGVLNAGGAVLSVSSAAFPYRLVLPVCKNGVYRFTNNAIDPHEQHPVEANGLEELVNALRKKYGEEEADWVEEAEKIGKWWGVEMRRRWRYGGAALQDDRMPEEMEGLGTVKKEHWWNT